MSDDKENIIIKGRWISKSKGGRNEGKKQKQRGTVTELQITCRKLISEKYLPFYLGTDQW